MEMSFGALLTNIRQRKPGLTQERIAHQMGYDAALIARMIAGKKDLTGPSGRSRVLAVIRILTEEGVLTTLDEANALLISAQLHPLHEAMESDHAVLNCIAHIKLAACNAAA